MQLSKTKILTYPGSRYRIEHEPDPFYDVEDIPETEWLALINFNNDDIPIMTKEEILRRIAALRSIDDAPHYSFNWARRDDPEFQALVKKVYQYSLNGRAHAKIYDLEKVLYSPRIFTSRF